jgi:hypothetical protein
MTKASKRYPRTTGVVANGVCGHSYTTRIGLPSYYGKICTKAKDKEVEGFKKNQADFMAKSICKTCRSDAILSQVTPLVKGVLESLGLPSLPDITGSYSQRAWAEQLRSDYLVSLISWGFAGVPTQSVFEYMNSHDAEEYTSPELLEQIACFDKIMDYLPPDRGYLSHVMKKEMETGSPLIRLRRLLVMRAIFKLNSGVILETRHTVWIMREKRGYTQFLSIFNNIPPKEFLSLSYVITKSLNNVEDYERLVESLSERVFERDKPIIDSIDKSENIINKLDMLNVFRTLSPEKEFPF